MCVRARNECERWANKLRIKHLPIQMIGRIYFHSLLNGIGGKSHFSFRPQDEKCKRRRARCQCTLQSFTTHKPNGNKLNNAIIFQITIGNSRILISFHLQSTNDRRCFNYLFVLIITIEKNRSVHFFASLLVSALLYSLCARASFVIRFVVCQSDFLFTIPFSSSFLFEF